MTEKLVKIGIPIDIDGRPSIEWMWAADLGANRYRLDNSPFFAYGLSWKDVVSARMTDVGLLLVAKLESSGHSTFRVAAPTRKVLSRNKYINQVESLGCTVERFNSALWAIDVPPGVDIGNVVELLSMAELNGVFSYEEGHIARHN